MPPWLDVIGHSAQGIAMSGTEVNEASEPKSRKRKLWPVLAALGLVLFLFLFGRYTEFLNIEALERAIGEFATGPWGVPAIILTFCACAFILCFNRDLSKRDYKKIVVAARIDTSYADHRARFRILAHYKNMFFLLCAKNANMKQ